MFPGRTSACGVLLIACASASHAVVTRHDVSDSLYQSLGNAFPSVGIIVTDSGYGSATLIGSSWVLTAAHVVETATSATFSPDGITPFSATGVFIHPAYDADTLANDFALGFIPGGVPGYAPSPYFAGSIVPGTMATSVGWGMTGDGNTGAITTDYRRRGFQNALDVIGPWGIDMDFDNPAGTSNVFGSPGALPLEGMTAYGDSGGGTFVDFGGGPWLVAITRAGDIYYNSGYGSEGYQSGITDAVAWIQATTGIGPVTAVPLPPGLWFTASGFAAIALRARRRAGAARHEVPRVTSPP